MRPSGAAGGAHGPMVKGAATNADVDADGDGDDVVRWLETSRDGSADDVAATCSADVADGRSGCVAADKEAEVTQH